MSSKRRIDNGKTSTEYKLYNPARFTPLKWCRTKTRNSISNDGSASSLFKLNELLLTSEVKKLLQTINQLSDTINSVVEDMVSSGSGSSDLRTQYLLWTSKPGSLSNKFAQPFVDSGKLTRLWERQSSNKTRLPRLWENYTNSLSVVWNDVASSSDEAGHSLKEVTRGVHEKTLKFAKDVSGKLEDEVASFERRHKIDISILTTLNLYICPDCKAILSLHKFRQGDCKCGQNVVNASQAERIPISLLAQGITEVIANNVWFEEGVAFAFKRENFNVYTGYNILGGSGVAHEIDVVAELPRDKIRVMVECKTTTLGIGDVFILSGKMRDVGISSGLICSAEVETNLDIARVARANGIIIAYDVLDKPRDFWKALFQKLV